MIAIAFFYKEVLETNHKFGIRVIINTDKELKCLIEDYY